MKILILSPSNESYATKRLLEIAEKRKHEATVIKPNEMYLLVSQANGHDRIYQKGKRIYLSDYDAVICRIGSGVDYGAFVVEHLQKNLGMFCTASGSGIRTASNKMLTIQKLSQEKIRVPKTMFLVEPENYEDIIKIMGGLPLIAKTVTGSQGVGVMIFNDDLSAKTALESFYKLGIKIILQEFLEAGAKDIRVFVINGEVVGAMERTGNKGDFRANISQGGTGAFIELTNQEKQMAIDVAKLLDLDICGVDLMRNKKDGLTYCIEANSNPNTEGFEKYTGIDVTTKIIEFVETNHKTRKNKALQAVRIDLPYLTRGETLAIQEGFFTIEDLRKAGKKI